jgi:hypothetical protein
MGWTHEDMRFTSDRAKPWETLVSAHRPLTDRGMYADTSRKLKANCRF